jgi:hypothetical protein
MLARIRNTLAAADHLFWNRPMDLMTLITQEGQKSSPFQNIREFLRDLDLCAVYSTSLSEQGIELVVALSICFLQAVKAIAI